MMLPIKDISVVLSLIASIVLAWIWIDARHARDSEVQSEILELRQENLEDDINQDAAWAAHYRRSVRDGIATQAEIERLEKLEKSLDRKYKKADRYEAEQSTRRTE